MEKALKQIEQAKNKGLISEDQAKSLTNKALNGFIGGGVDAPKESSEKKAKAAMKNIEAEKNKGNITSTQANKLTNDTLKNLVKASAREGQGDNGLTDLIASGRATNQRQNGCQRS